MSFARLARLSSTSVPRCRPFSSSSPEIVLKKLEGSDKGVIVLSMDRPKAKNALGKTMVAEVRTNSENCIAAHLLIQTLVPTSIK